MSQTITGNITGSFDEAWKKTKTFAEQASAWLEDFDNPEGRVAYARTGAIDAMADHVTGEVGEAKRGLEQYITTQLSAAQVNKATAVTSRLAVQPPPPPQPTPPALPEELLKSFKADIMKAVTEATRQSFVASGMKMMTEMIGNLALGRRGSSLSANDADHAQRRTAVKQGSVVDQLKTKAGWKVIRTSNNRGGGSGGGAGGLADGVAANVAAPPGPPLVAEQTHPQASGGKRVTDKEVPTAQAAKDGGVGITSAPAGQSGANKDGEAGAAPPASASPSAAQGNAKAASAVGDAPASAKGPPSGHPLRAMLCCIEAHSMDVQQHPVVDAGLAGTARHSVTPQVAGTSSGAPPAAHEVATPPPADPKSAATPTSLNATAPSSGAAVVDAAAEKGVSAALATGGRTDKHAEPAAVLAHFEAAKRPKHAPALAIMDTAHVVPSATHGGGSAEPTAATSAVAERNAGRKGKDDIGKGKAVSQRSTRAMTAGKEMSEEKGKKAEGNQDKTDSKGKPAKKEKAEEEEEEEEGGEGDKEHGRRGHGIRQDRSDDRHGWVGEIKVNGQNRYIGKSREKMELAYEHAIAYVVYDGYVSKVLMKELTLLKPGELDKWKEVWAEVKFLPTGMWMVAASAAFGKVDASVEGKAGEKTEMEGADGKADEKTEMGAQALAASACALWCFVETGASVLGAVGEGKAAAMVAGAGEERAEDFKKVMLAVIDLARSRQAPAGEVAHNVAPALQSQAVARAFKEGVEEVEADMIARATVETLAF
ncbi:unnamed protein product [Closterium sp. NIES-65]|nr:unnamed protein product [Closterium sp. NIES-65]